MQQCIVCTHHAPVESNHLEGLEKPRDKNFQRMHVRQLEKAKNSFLVRSVRRYAIFQITIATSQTAIPTEEKAWFVT